MFFLAGELTVPIDEVGQVLGLGADLLSSKREEEVVLDDEEIAFSKGMEISECTPKLDIKTYSNNGEKAWNLVCSIMSFVDFRLGL